jgi:archaemetzincin
MNLVHLLRVGSIDASLLEYLRVEIPRSLAVACEILPFDLDPASAYHAERQQYHSSEILQRMQGLVRPKDWRFLAVADVDLYIPILKYIFGEAQMGGPCALVSTFRLRQEFYGLDRDDALLNQRLLKESVHELGHTLDLRHCQDYRCVMASSHAVEWVDLRERALCQACRAQLEVRQSLADVAGNAAHHKPPIP